MNPIELAFNHVKNLLSGKEFDKDDNFENKVEQAFASITAKQASGFERHCQKFYNQCRLGIPFLVNILNPDVCDNIALAVAMPAQDTLPAQIVLPAGPPDPPMIETNDMGLHGPNESHAEPDKDGEFSI